MNLKFGTPGTDTFFHFFNTCQRIGLQPHNTTLLKEYSYQIFLNGTLNESCGFTLKIAKFPLMSTLQTVLTACNLTIQWITSQRYYNSLAYKIDREKVNLLIIRKLCISSFKLPFHKKSTATPSQAVFAKHARATVLDILHSMSAEFAFCIFSNPAGQQEYDVSQRLLVRNAG